MDLRDGEDFREEARPIDHVELEDGALIVFDPAASEAWIECRSPIDLVGRN